MKAINARTSLFALAAAPTTLAARTWARNAPPDARFVELRLKAVAVHRASFGKPGVGTVGEREHTRQYALRAILVNQQRRQNPSASYARKRAYGMPATTARDRRRLVSWRGYEALGGAVFDTAFANAQLGIMTDAEAQYGAYSQNGKSGPLRAKRSSRLLKGPNAAQYARRIAGQALIDNPAKVVPARHLQRPKIFGMRGVGTEMLGIGTCGNFWRMPVTPGGSLAEPARRMERGRSREGHAP